jgi:hypothetical protein
MNGLSSSDMQDGTFADSYIGTLGVEFVRRSAPLPCSSLGDRATDLNGRTMRWWYERRK